MPHVFDDPAFLFGPQRPGLDRRALFHEGWKALLALFASADDLAAQWQEYRFLRHDYVKVDLLSDVDRLVPTLDDKTLFWITNAFSFKRTLRFYGHAGVRDKFEHFKAQVAPTGAVVTGRGPGRLKIHGRL